MADVNSESRTIDEQMDRLTRREPTKLKVTELLKPSIQQHAFDE